MAYTKKFLNKSGISSPISGLNSNTGAWNSSSGQGSGSTGSTDFGYKNYMSRLPEVYTGHPNRIERYNQYEMMDVDAEINACLDIISEFSTQKNDHNKTPFSFEFKEEPTPHEVELLTKQLHQWCKLNELDTRMFKIFRNVLKYGDQVFVRDPENFKLYWVDMVKVIKVVVNESEGKLPEQYVLKDMNINLQNLTVAEKTNTDFAANPATGFGGTGAGAQGAGSGGYTVPAMPYNTTGSRFTLGQSESAIDAKHIVHLSLTEGLDRFWPFGESILENIFKVYKQKELLEDAILIYRVQRAPERRLFKIDVGNMPSHMAMSFVERVKNEIHQRRIPSTLGGQSVVDATYNPLSMNEDYFFPMTAEGRGSSIEVLPGGQNLGEIDDLKYFNNRLARGLRVPSSYLPTGPEDNPTPLSDGRVGTAMIQEFRFNQYCERLQNYICQKLDEEFKLFLRWRGFNIDTSLFDITFNPPQNFAAYRQSELDTARVSTFSTVEAFPYISKRFAMERFLGLTEEEISKNEKLWAEENKEKVESEPEGSDLRNVGISTGNFDADFDTAENVEAGEEAEGEGLDVAGPVGAETPSAEPGAPPAPPPPPGAE
jgi:hypothetical protein